MKGLDVVEQRKSIIQRAMKTADGVKMMELLNDHFGGDTFDADPYTHAFNAGQRSVVIWIETYLKAKNNGNS